jgi:hypothetical protein
VKRAVFGAVVFLLVLGAACGGDGGEDEPEGSFSASARESLRGYVEEDAAEHGWAAGCLWPLDGPDDSTAPLGFLGLTGELGTDYGSGTIGNVDTNFLATVYALDFAGEPSELEESESEDYYCLRSSAEPGP